MNIAGEPVTPRELLANALGGLAVLVAFIALCALAAAFAPGPAR